MDRAEPATSPPADDAGTPVARGVRFVVGRAQSGKTRHCVERIVALARAQPLGPPIYYVVPKQATFSVERRLTLTAGLEGGFARVRVVSFDRLADDVIAECGGDAVPAVTARGRRIVLAHLLRTLSPKLRVYRRSAQRLGLADELDATFAELERHGHDETTLARAIAQLAAAEDGSPAAKTLLDKLHDLHLIYTAYQVFLSDERVDPHRRLNQVLDLVHRCESIRASYVFVDGHLEFDHFERRMLAALARQVRAVEITMLLDPASAVLEGHPPAGDGGRFDRTERAYARLAMSLRREGVPILPPVRLPDPAAAHGAEPLAHVERCLAASHSSPLHPSTDDLGTTAVTAASLPDRRAEVAAAASVVRRWMREEGMRPRQVAVLCRSIDGWHDLIQATFAEYGIPLFTDRRRTASHHPMLQLVGAMLRAVLERWPHDAMMALTKGGLAGLAPREADELENYVLEHAIRGDGWARPEPWRFDQRRTPGDATDDGAADEDVVEPALPPDGADRLRRRLVAPLEALGQAFARDGDSAPEQQVRTMAAALLRTIDAYGAPETLAAWIQQSEAAGDLEQAAEHEQVWAELCDLLDELVDLLGEERMSPAQFGEVIAAALAQFDLAITPATVDQVMVGDVERTRFDHFDGVVLLGLNEGEFPLASAEATVLGDRERRLLEARQFALEPDGERRLLDEPLLLYLGVTRARRRLFVTRRLADDDGRQVNPSSYWLELARLLPEAFAPAAVEAFAIAPTPRGVVSDLASWARRGAPVGDAADRRTAALYDAVLSALPPGDRIGALLRRAWPALSYDNAARLEPATVARLYPEGLLGSVSQIETYAACPYRHFAGRVLKLKPRPEPEPSITDMGSLYHGVLERLVREQIHRNAGWGKPPDAAAIRAAAERSAEDLRGQLMLSSARNQYVLEQLQENVAASLKLQHAFGQQGKLKPAWVELAFGLPDSAAAPPPVEAFCFETPRGRAVQLRGKVDRVDTAQATGAFAVFDYKTRTSSLDLCQVVHGLSLQLLTYLLVLKDRGEALAKLPLTPIAAFYIQLIEGLEKLDHPDDPPSDAQIRGIVHTGYVGLLQAADAEPSFLKLGLNKDGSFSAKRSGDGVSDEEFDAILRFAQSKLAELADQILDGEIAVRPYLLNDRSPCGWCDYACVCRFERPPNEYLSLHKLGRRAALESIVAGAAKAGGA